MTKNGKMESPPSSEQATITSCVLPSLEPKMWLNTKYDLVQYAMVVVIFKS